jgi:hypothetical protein
MAKKKAKDKPTPEFKELVKTAGNLGFESLQTAKPSGPLTIMVAKNAIAAGLGNENLYTDGVLVIAIGTGVFRGLEFGLYLELPRYENLIATGTTPAELTVAVASAQRLYKRLQFPNLAELADAYDRVLKRFGFAPQTSIEGYGPVYYNPDETVEVAANTGEFPESPIGEAVPGIGYYISKEPANRKKAKFILREYGTPADLETDLKAFGFKPIKQK